MVKDADGGWFEGYLHHSTVAKLLSISYNRRPEDYSTSAPPSKDYDFLEATKRVK